VVITWFQDFSKGVGVKYDMQILADRIEFFWIHIKGIGALENSLWGYDGEALRIWLDALKIGANTVNNRGPGPVIEHAKLPLDFYPLCELPSCFRAVSSWSFSGSHG
jgi:RAB6A-GEF complex partner protein 1